jgi:hypothetical protein
MIEYKKWFDEECEYEHYIRQFEHPGKYYQDEICIRGGWEVYTNRFHCISPKGFTSRPMEVISEEEFEEARLRGVAILGNYL